MMDKEIFQTLEKHLMEDEVPSRYINKITSEPFFTEYPFKLLLKLKGIKQSPKYHPEGDVWNHTMMVLDEAAKVKNRSSNPRSFMWAALLHDIGKPDTTRERKGKITSYDHEKVGADIAKDFLGEFVSDEEFIKEVAALVRWHMQILFVVNNLPFAQVKDMKKEVDIEDIGLLGWCDRMGRGNPDPKTEKENIEVFLEKCKIK
ncbi:putative nucleotidyltransferase with HDIG domain [Mobilisporobacter senegalensis]|uniref:Putative nucleotidyltransferase with HDIG domain n=1 Tax=Mobilisporobacter senegalensis TaxID=1329262 RepID=A0A3N1XV47_9FIRM|nr:HDIG domain-containing metalloprotein [Mobilisporobacter senegalensis]ROR30499.1 putative nucleotidyltransferase with HDIG domain [Mobilisporobacter senegalensis]